MAFLRSASALSHRPTPSIPPYHRATHQLSFTPTAPAPKRRFTRRPPHCPPCSFDRDGAGPSYDAPRERPRLNLAPRTAPLDKPAGGDAAAAPAAAAGDGAEAAEAAKPAEPKAAKSNPFGAARPREEVLKEQGRDYRKEELQLEHKAAEVLRCGGGGGIC